MFNVLLFLLYCYCCFFPEKRRSKSREKKLDKFGRDGMSDLKSLFNFADFVVLQMMKLCQEVMDQLSMT